MSVNWGYVAGIIDGEGCIEVVCQQSRYIVRVTVCQQDVRLIKWLADHTGIKTTYRMRDERNKYVTYQWRVAAQDDVRRLLQRIVRYLIVKREQAELALELLNGKSPVRVVERMKHLKRCHYQRAAA